jgi:hypothetical protein
MKLIICLIILGTWYWWFRKQSFKVTDLNPTIPDKIETVLEIDGKLYDIEKDWDTIQEISSQKVIENRALRKSK